MPPEDTDQPQLTSTWLVIPYFADDMGRKGAERPLDPGKALSWLCPGIIVGGQPGKTSFQRGVPMSVTVDVANWGAGGQTAPVQIRLWWADPTLAFSKAKPFGQAVALVPANGKPVRSAAIAGVIPSTAPAHVCLLAHVAAPMDSSPAGSVPDPVGDRHWAQLNLVETVPSSTGTFRVAVNAGNPFPFEVEARVHLRALEAAELRTLSQRLQRDVDALDPSSIEMRRDGERREALRVGPGEQVRIELSGRADQVPAAFEVRQSIEGDDRELVGSIGILVDTRDEG